jgi:hypothetical protein
VALDSSDPDLDLFAVGVILHELVTGRHPYTDRDPISGRFEPNQDLEPGLRQILERATAPKRDDRFASAGEFLDALAALDVDVAVELPSAPTDVVEQLREIERAMIDLDWDRAIALAPPEWLAVRQRIEARRAVEDEADSTEPLLEVHGFSLTLVDTRRFQVAKNLTDQEVGPGDVTEYLVRGPDGVMIQLLDHATDDGQRWVMAADVFQTPPPLRRLGHGLRLSVVKRSGSTVIDLRQARLKPDGWSTLRKASPVELDGGAGADVASILGSFGATAYGTRATVWGDTGKQRSFICVAGPAETAHLPAVVYFITRVLPIARGVTAT